MWIKREVYLSYAIYVCQNHPEFRQFFPLCCHFLAIFDAVIPAALRMTEDSHA